MLPGGRTWDSEGGEQTMGPKDCGGCRRCHSYEGESISYLWIYWRSTLSPRLRRFLGLTLQPTRPAWRQGTCWWRCRGSWSPWWPTPRSRISVAFVCKLCRWYNFIKYLYHEVITVSSVWSNVEMVQIGYLCFNNNKIMLHCYIWAKLISSHPSLFCQ